MKKVVLIEIFVFALLLALAAAVCIGVPLGAFAPDTLPTETTQAATAPTEETTEPTIVPETTVPQTLPPPDVEITWATYPADRELTCTHAFVYDCQSESYIYLLGDNREQIYPASITKLMSIHVAMQYLDPTWELTAGSILDRIPEDASTAKLEKGDVMKVDMLIEAMLLPSGNDAAYMIATEAGREIAGDPDLSVDEAIAVFVEEMNCQAQALGMTGTHYVNPDGWHDSDHYTNFDDLVTVAKLMLQNDTVMGYAKIPKVTVTPVAGEDKEWINTNLLVNPETIYYCPYTIGLKTGQTEAAGSCLLSAFDVEGRIYIVGVFGSPTFNDKLDDTLQIFNSTVVGK